MTLGVLFVSFWFALIAAYLLWQFATGALAGADIYEIEPVLVPVALEPAAVAAPVSMGAALRRLPAAS